MLQGLVEAPHEEQIYLLVLLDLLWFKKLLKKNNFRRISHDVLELVEHSLDVNLAGNRIRYKFVDTPILDGVSIHETYDNVVVLVPTVCSVHRLIFPHPDKYHRQDHVAGAHPDLAAPSIFSEATANDARDPSTFHFFTNSSKHKNRDLTCSN